MVFAMVTAWYANISDRPGRVMKPGDALVDGDTIQSMGSASSLPYLRVPCDAMHCIIPGAPAQQVT